MNKRPTPEISQQLREAPTIDLDVVDHEDSEAGEEIRATVAALMPWGISILAHVALITLAFFLVWQTIVTQEQRPFVPELTTAPIVSPPSSTIPDPTQDTSAGGAAFAIEVTPMEPIDVITVGFEFPGPPIVCDSIGDLDNPFRGPGKDKTPGIIFPPFDPSGSADVVFLIDASGSMVDVLPFVINELKQVVNSISADRKATVIFFSGDGVAEVPGGGGVKGLRPMTAHFKQQVQQWVSLENFMYQTGGRGSAFVGEALTRALSYKPDRIILLSDNLTGGGQGATQHELMQDDLLALIHKHNTKRPKVAIDTIQFLYDDPLVRAGLQGTLDRIAQETGGKPRFISQSELNLR